MNNLGSGPPGGMLPGYPRQTMYPVRLVSIPVLSDLPGGSSFQVGTANVHPQLARPGMVLYFPDQRNTNHFGFQRNHFNVPFQQTAPNYYQNQQPNYQPSNVSPYYVSMGVGDHIRDPRLLLNESQQQQVLQPIPTYPRMNFYGPFGENELMSGRGREGASQPADVQKEEKSGCSGSSSDSEVLPEASVQAVFSEETSSNDSESEEAFADEGMDYVANVAEHMPLLAEVHEEAPATPAGASGESRVDNVDIEESILTLELPAIEREVKARNALSPSKKPSGWRLDVKVSLICDMEPDASKGVSIPAQMGPLHIDTLWSDRTKSSDAVEMVAGAESSSSSASNVLESVPEAKTSSTAAPNEETCAGGSTFNPIAMDGDGNDLSDKYGCAICADSLECAASRRVGGVFIKAQMSSINPKEVVATPCGHLFHKYCLYFWFYTDTMNKYTRGQGQGFLNILPLFSSASAWACPICRLEIPGPKSLLKVFPSNVTASGPQDEELDAPVHGSQSEGQSGQCTECAILQHVVLQRNVLQAEVDTGLELARQLSDEIGILRGDLVICDFQRTRLGFQYQDLSQMNRQLALENFHLRNIVQTLSGPTGD